MRKWAAWRGASPRAGAIWVPVVFDIKFGSGILGPGFHPALRDYGATGRAMDGRALTSRRDE